MTRKSGKATISCDFKSSQSPNTAANDPDDYKAAEGIAAVWMSQGKKGVRVGIEVVYDLEEEEEDLIEKDSNDVIPIAKRARNLRLDGLILTAPTRPQRG